LQKGDDAVHCGQNTIDARHMFLAAKEAVCIIEGDFSWAELTTELVHNALKLASDWAYYRIATLPFANDDDQIQEERLSFNQAANEAHVLWLLTNIAQGGTCPLCDLISFLPTAFQHKCYARLHLHKAKLGFIAGVPTHRNARALFQAACFLALNAMFEGPENSELTVAVIQWVFDPLYLAPRQGPWNSIQRAT
jgi:hypothetical protein